MPDAPVRRSWFRRHWFPLSAIVAVVLSRLAIAAMQRFDVALDYNFAAVLGSQFLLLAAILAVAVWFLFFSGYSFRLKAAGVGVVVAAAVGLVACVEKVEFDGSMNPIFRWRWETKVEELLARQRAEAGGPVGGANLEVGPHDSPAFRGPAGDGVAPTVPLADDWATPPTIVWTKYVGPGHAGIAVAGNSLVTLEQDGPNEAVVCYDKDTGDERWRHTYPAQFDHTENMGGGGPRTTPAVADGMVYTVGATGELTCVEALTGKERWRVNVIADNGADVPEWGVSASPAVWKDFVIINPGTAKQGGTKQAVAAYNRLTGKKIWASGSAAAAYASPQVATLGGMPQVLVFDAVGLGGYDAVDGTELWRFPWKTPMGMNSAQPLVVGPDRVLISSEIDNGAAVVEVRKADGKWEPKPVWKARSLAARFSSPVVHNGHVYGLSNRRLVCVSAETGKQLWTEGGYSDGQVILCGDKLVVSDGAGKLCYVAADPAEYRLLGKVTVFPDRTWNVPAMAGNRVYLRNHRQMACLELPTTGK
jgi:outer membrane protein assembly factor BamB